MKQEENTSWHGVQRTPSRSFAREKQSNGVVASEEMCQEMFYMCLHDDYHNPAEKGERNDDGEEGVAIAESVICAEMEKHGYITHVQKCASLEADLMISLT